MYVKLDYITGADAGFRVRGGASGVSRISATWVFKVRPHTKSGGGGAIRFRSDIKSGRGGGGGGNSLQVQYEKWGGGGGGAGQFASGVRYEKWGGIPLQVRYLCLAHRKNLHVPTYVLPRYTSHARAKNELKIHAGKG